MHVDSGGSFGIRFPAPLCCRRSFAQPLPPLSAQLPPALPRRSLTRFGTAPLGSSSVDSSCPNLATALPSLSPQVCIASLHNAAAVVVRRAQHFLLPPEPLSSASRHPVTETASSAFRHPAIDVRVFRKSADGPAGTQGSSSSAAQSMLWFFRRGRDDGRVFVSFYVSLVNHRTKPHCT